MATYTTNYNLKKPEATDPFGDFRTDYNDNMDIIDANLGGGGGSSSLAGLSDVNLTTPTDGQVLTYDGNSAEWVNANPSGGGDTVSWSQLQASGTKIAEIDINGTTTDVYAPSGGGGGHTIVDENDQTMPARTYLKFAGDVAVTDDSVNDETIVTVTGGGGASSLAGLSDVNLTTPSDGQVLTYDGNTSKWVNANASGGNHVYSTNEQVVGTWINGKPIYQKTWSFSQKTLPTNTWYSLTGVSVPNCDTPINAIGRSARYACPVNVDMIDNPISVMSTLPNNEGRLSSITLEYTKTTD